MVKRTGAYSQTAWEVRQQEREAKWRGHLSSWQSSGLSQAEYCRRKNLTPADFSWWKHELARRNWRRRWKATRRDNALAGSEDFPLCATR
jgi:hypothetical protein